MFTDCTKFEHWLKRVCTKFAIYLQFVSIKIKFKLSSSQEPSKCLFDLITLYLSVIFLCFFIFLFFLNLFEVCTTFIEFSEPSAGLPAMQRGFLLSWQLIWLYSICLFSFNLKSAQKSVKISCLFREMDSFWVRVICSSCLLEQPSLPHQSMYASFETNCFWES